MSKEELTQEEIKAIKSLERLAKKWPQSLILFAHGGELSIRKGGYGQQFEVASVAGIPNDGGDGGDKF